MCSRILKAFIYSFNFCCEFTKQTLKWKILIPYAKHNDRWGTIPTNLSCSFTSEQRHSQTFCFRLNVQECLYTKQLGKIVSLSTGRRANLFSDQNNEDNVSLQGKGGAALLAALLKDWGFQHLGFFHCAPSPLCMYRRGKWMFHAEGTKVWNSSIWMHTYK